MIRSILTCYSVYYWEKKKYRHGPVFSNGIGCQVLNSVAKVTSKSMAKKQISSSESAEVLARSGTSEESGIYG